MTRSSHVIAPMPMPAAPAPAGETTADTMPKLVNTSTPSPTHHTCTCDQVVACAESLRYPRVLHVPKFMRVGEQMIKYNQHNNHSGTRWLMWANEALHWSHHVVASITTHHHSVDLTHLLSVWRGKHAKHFLTAMGKHAPADRCFSLIIWKDDKIISVDLEAPSVEKRNMWCFHLNRMVQTHVASEHFHKSRNLRAEAFRQGYVQDNMLQRSASEIRPGVRDASVAAIGIPTTTSSGSAAAAGVASATTTTALASPVGQPLLPSQPSGLVRSRSTPASAIIHVDPTVLATTTVHPSAETQGKSMVKSSSSHNFVMLPRTALLLEEGSTDVEMDATTVAPTNSDRQRNHVTFAEQVTTHSIASTPLLHVRGAAVVSLAEETSQQVIVAASSSPVAAAVFHAADPVEATECTCESSSSSSSSSSTKACVLHVDIPASSQPDIVVDDAIEPIVVDRVPDVDATAVELAQEPQQQEQQQPPVVIAITPAPATTEMTTAAAATTTTTMTTEDDCGVDGELSSVTSSLLLASPSTYMSPSSHNHLPSAVAAPEEEEEALNRGDDDDDVPHEHTDATDRDHSQQRIARLSPVELNEALEAAATSLAQADVEPVAATASSPSNDVDARGAEVSVSNMLAVADAALDECDTADAAATETSSSDSDDCDCVKQSSPASPPSSSSRRVDEEMSSMFSAMNATVVGGRMCSHSTSPCSSSQCAHSAADRFSPTSPKPKMSAPVSNDEDVVDIKPATEAKAAMAVTATPSPTMASSPPLPTPTASERELDMLRSLVVQLQDQRRGEQMKMAELEHRYAVLEASLMDKVVEHEELVHRVAVDALESREREAQLMARVEDANAAKQAEAQRATELEDQLRVLENLLVACDHERQRLFACNHQLESALLSAHRFDAAIAEEDDSRI